MLYVTATHALVWYIPGELHDKVDEIFKSAEAGESTIFIPTIVLAECLYLVENGKIELEKARRFLGKAGGAALAITVSQHFNLDFDDAYQYVAA